LRTGNNSVEKELTILSVARWNGTAVLRRLSSRFRIEEESEANRLALRKIYVWATFDWRVSDWPVPLARGSLRSES
jgi:hypothetical protein